MTGKGGVGHMAHKTLPRTQLGYFWPRTWVATRLCTTMTEVATSAFHKQAACECAPCPSLVLVKRTHLYVRAHLRA